MSCQQANRFLGFLRDQQDEMLEDLKLFVKRETSSTDKELLDDFAHFLSDYATTVAGGRAKSYPRKFPETTCVSAGATRDGDLPIYPARPLRYSMACGTA
jgi:hypothetical protein